VATFLAASIAAVAFVVLQVLLNEPVVIGDGSRWLADFVRNGGSEFSYAARRKIAAPDS
jgi:hypothetical protein